MAQRAEQEIHEYLDELCRNKFFGETTFYFQDGEIGNIRETARLGKKDIIEKVRGAPERRKVLVAVRRSAE